MSISHVSDSPLVNQAKKRANHLKSILKPQLPEIKHSACLEIIAKLERERDWNTYLAKLKKTDPIEYRDEVDNFIKKTALPLLTSIATKYNMKVITDPSKIANGEANPRKQSPRRLALRIEPRNQQLGGTYCDPFLDVSTTSLRLGNNTLTITPVFIFPEEALPVLTQLLSGDKINDDAEPQISRFGIEQERRYTLSVSTSSISDSVDHSFNIFTDPKMVKILQKGFDRFFKDYRRTVKAYLAMQGKWGNKKLLTIFENALWKLNTEDPPYMATSNRFYTSTIGGLHFHGAICSSGPYIIGAEDSTDIGACSIIHLDDGNDGKPRGYYIAKYGDCWQTKIYLKEFSERDIDKLTREFGIPRGRFSEEQTSFYQTPAFNALCTWAGANSKYAKRIGRKGGRYLPDWYARVIAKKLSETAKPTAQDLKNAIEKEPYLFVHGIHCSSHIDRKNTPEENKEIFTNQRELFAHSGYREFSLCCEWLQGCNKRKTINTSISSYRLKHLVEAWAKKTGHDASYVSNGAFIAAAIHMGFDWSPGVDSPNAWFNISGKSPAIVELKGVSII